MSLTTDAKERKDVPICTGVLDYFPDAIAEVARVSKAGNEQHHAGAPLHWDKSKSTDEADCIARHLLERGTLDSDGMRHSAKVAWRALALLQRELDAEKEKLSNSKAFAVDKMCNECYLHFLSGEMAYYHNGFYYHENCKP